MNPFNKLKVHRDEDDFETVENPKDTKDVLFKDTKVKKVRPEKKEDKEVQQSEEGFTQVGKVTKNSKVVLEEEEVAEKKPGKKDPQPKYHDKRTEQNFRAGSDKRQFDRISGTGRGKEVKKEGRGGKGTWEGNRRLYDNYDNADYYFDKAIRKQNEPVEEVVVEEVKVKVEEKKEEIKVEETEKKEEVVEEGAKKKKKDKKTEETPVDEKDKLEIPKDALTLQQYKEKNANITSNATKTVAVKVDLEEVDKREDTVLQATTTKKVGGKKQKTKNNKEDSKAAELMKNLNLQVEDNTPKQRKFK